jgi:hypothetical protein
VLRWVVGIGGVRGTERGSRIDRGSVEGCGLCRVCVVCSG